MRKPKALADRRYYIRRKSELDDTLFFCADAGAPIWFKKVVWASALLSTFTPEQQAQVVLRAMGEGDVDYREWLRGVLPETVTVDEYLAAIEQTVADRRAGREPSRRAVRRFEKQAGWR